MSINIISASPCDEALTRSLASGAVASAEALMAETAARGQANAVKIGAEADAARETIAARAVADATTIKASGTAEADRIIAAGARDAEVTRADGVARGMENIGGVAITASGQCAVVQRLAEQYVCSLSDMAKHSQMIIVPEQPNNVGNVMATALGMGNVVSENVKKLV